QRYRLKQRIDATRRHQSIRHRYLLVRQVIGDNSFQFRNHLAIEFTRVIQCPTEERYLEEQLERNQRRRQINNLRSSASQMLANQIEIARQSAITTSQTPIDTAILKRAKNSASQWRDRKEFEDMPIIKERRHPCLRFTGIRAGAFNITIERKGIALVLFLWIVKVVKRGIGCS